MSWDDFNKMSEDESFHLIANKPSLFSGTSKGLQRCETLLKEMGKCETTEELILLAHVCSSGGDRFRKAVALWGVECIEVKVNNNNTYNTDNKLTKESLGQTHLNTLLVNHLENAGDSIKKVEFNPGKEGHVSFVKRLFLKLVKEICGVQGTQNENNKKNEDYCFTHRLSNLNPQLVEDKDHRKREAMFVNNLKNNFHKKFNFSGEMKKVEFPRLGNADYTIQGKLHCLDSSTYAGSEDYVNVMKGKREQYNQYHNYHG